MSAQFRVGDRVRMGSAPDLVGVVVGHTGSLIEVLRDESPRRPANSRGWVHWPFELELVEAAPLNVPADPDAEPQPYDMPSPEADALDRIAALIEEHEPRKLAIQHEVGASPSDHYATVPSFTLRETVRAFDSIAAILRETGRL